VFKVSCTDVANSITRGVLWSRQLKFDQVFDVICWLLRHQPPPRLSPLDRAASAFEQLALTAAHADATSMSRSMSWPLSSGTAHVEAQAVERLRPPPLCNSTGADARSDGLDAFASDVWSNAMPDSPGGCADNHCAFSRRGHCGRRLRARAAGPGVRRVPQLCVVGTA
jgi:hypothetical protein